MKRSSLGTLEKKNRRENEIAFVVGFLVPLLVEHNRVESVSVVVCDAVVKFAKSCAAGSLGRNVNFLPWFDFNSVRFSCCCDVVDIVANGSFVRHSMIGHEVVTRILHKKSRNLRLSLTHSLSQ